MLILLLVVANFVFHSSTAAPVRFGRIAVVRRLRGGGDNGDNRVLIRPTDVNCSATTKNTTLIQVQIIHRHGDRTPITPLVNEEYWHSTLPQPHVLEQMSKGIRLKRNNNNNDEAAMAGEKHDAQGRPPFGQLTALGLLQMVQLGTKLREDLVQEDDDTLNDKNYSSLNYNNNNNKLFTKEKPLHPKRIKARSTDFPRTIQSLQALLVGLFPDGISLNNGNDDNDDCFMEIDLRHSKFHIPDPQPRHTKQQELLERQLALREHMIQKDYAMSPLAIKVTNELMVQNVIQVDEAKRISSGFHVGGLSPNDNENKMTVLPWAQLAEVTKCLRVHNLLPSNITHEEQDWIVQHASWRWFETMRHPKMGKLAMHHMMTDIISNIKNMIQTEQKDDDALLHIYSAHDSTLIALMCAFQLDPPTHWPEYASYLKIELIAIMEEEQPEPKISENPSSTAIATFPTNVQYYVRFSLNGSILRCAIGRTENEDALDMIPLEKLQDYILDLSHLDNDTEEIMEATSNTE